MTNPNLFSHVASSLPEELVDLLVDCPQVRIERIVSTGHSSPPGFWYDQSEHEWVVVLQGEAELVWEDQPEAIRLVPGDHVFILAHRKHRVQWTTPDQPTIWLAVFFR